MDDQYGFQEVSPDTYICIADSDTRAVMGAKTSRAPHLQHRWEELMASNDGEMWPWGDPPEMVEKFLDKNLKGYMHASIAEMAEVFVHGRGMGWPSAWLIEDSPLFVGQEVSTRAIDVLKEDSDPCKYSDRRLHGIHDRWVELFSKLQDQAGNRGYKFDEIRWTLPGTTRSGVTMCNKVRDGVRQLERIAGMGLPFIGLANQMLSGFKAYAPRATDAVLRGNRRPPSTWDVPTKFYKDNAPSVTTRKGCVSLKSRTAVTSKPPPKEVSREKSKTYMDPAWNFFGPFELSIHCSVAAARDWHRHRAVMPWEITVPIDEDRNLIKSPYYDMSVIKDDLWEETSRKFAEVYTDPDVPRWAAMHALPFGAVVKLRCQGRLPALLYMLELRYSSKGANPEYKDQAKHGLYQLAAQLGPSITDREHILGTMGDEDLAMWENVKEYM